MTIENTPQPPAGEARPPSLIRAIPWLLVAGLLVLMAAGLSGLDRSVAEAVRAHPVTATGWVHVAAKRISVLGRSECYVVPTLLLLAWWWRFRIERRLFKLCLWLLAAEAASGLVTRILKIVFGRWRPTQLANGHFGFDFFQLAAKRNSFPSGHTSDAMSVAVVLWFVCPRLRPVAAAWVVLMGAARVLVLDHFVADVAVGAVVGLVCTLALRPYFVASCAADNPL